MIAPEKLQNALCALNRLLVVARTMAYQRKDHSDLAAVLDVAEYLPRLLSTETEDSDGFREQLAGLADRWPEFQSAVEKFDDPNLEVPW